MLSNIWVPHLIIRVSDLHSFDAESDPDPGFKKSRTNPDQVYISLEC